MKKWYDYKTADSDVVISSRIRLARNISGYEFSPKLDPGKAAELVERLITVKEDLAKSEKQTFSSCMVALLPDAEKKSLVEWHAISPALTEKKQATGLILSEDDSISIMLNEEDHLRIQAITPGISLHDALGKADRADNIFEERFDYAYSPKYGYLTSCPTNIGTGLRASCMLFLPALSFSDKIGKLAAELQKFGAAIRGIYGEGSRSLGYLYQISNQKTLGRTERDICGYFEQLVGEVVERERESRKILLDSNYKLVEDKVFRSYGILKYAKSLNVSEAMLLLAQVKLGADTGILRFSPDYIDYADATFEGSVKSAKEDVTAPSREKPLRIQPNIHLLMMEIQPATIRKRYGKPFGTGEQNRYRAKYLNDRLPELE